jgi:hypothetical protein
VAVWRSIFFVLNSHVRTVDRSWWWRCDWPGRWICRDECKPWHWYQRGDCRLQEPCLSFHDVSSFFFNIFLSCKRGSLMNYSYGQLWMLWSGSLPVEHHALKMRLGCGPNCCMQPRRKCCIAGAVRTSWYVAHPP